MSSRKLPARDGTECANPGASMLDTSSENSAIYPDVQSLTRALGAGEDIDLNLPNAQYAMLRWPYDLRAAPAGAIALGAGGAASLAGNVSADGFCALVREIPDGVSAVDMLAGLASSVRMPREVRSLDDIAPGSWIIAEVSGSFHLSLEVTYGYDLSWIRQVAGGALKGDIGLRVLAGIGAQLGCAASGKYVIAISRGLNGPEQRQIRVQLFQVRDREWSAGLASARITLAPVQELLPQDFDEFLKGVLGIQAPQILKDVQEIEQWTAAASGEAKAYLERVFAFWNQLPQQVTAFLWSKLPDQNAIGQIASFAAQISKLAPGDLDSLLQNELSKIGFLISPAGILLESIAEPDILAAIGNAAGLQQISKTASVISGLLNDATLLGLLQRLQVEINQRLDLQQIEDAVDAGSLSKLDAWMVNRLEAFFGDRTPLSLKDLEQLAEQLRKIAALRDTLYSKALQALQKQYAFAFTASWQSTNSATTLIDLAFDFEANPAGAERGLALAIDGRFDQILCDPTDTGVLLNKGILTHGIRRQSSVELALPYHDSKRSHVTNVLATLSAVDQAGARLIAYNGSANELIAVANEWQSAVSISIAAGTSLTPGVTIHNPTSATYSHSLSAALKQLTRAGLKQRFAAELVDYFPSVFAVTAGLEPIDQWLDALIGAGKTEIGDALLWLDVALPPAYVLGWMKAPLDKRAPQYIVMAEMLRRKFRAFLLQQYFTDIARYGNVADGSPAFTLLVFAAARADALPALLRQVRDTLAAAGRSDLTGYYADYQASRIIASAASSPATPMLFAAEGQIVEQAKNAALALARFQSSQFRNPAEALKQLAGFGAKVTSAFHGALETYATGDLLLPLGALLFAEAARAFDPTLEPGTANVMFALQVVKCSPFPPAGFPQNAAVPPGEVLLESRFVNVAAVNDAGATNSRQRNRDSSAQLLRA